MSETSSSTMFGCFPAVIIAMILGVLAFVSVRQEASMMAVEPPAQAPATASGGEQNSVQSMTVIEQIETQVSTSTPATITMHIRGYQPDGCTFPVQVQQSRVDSQVTVRIFRVKPVDVMCSMELNPYDETITLITTFESGDYTIDVNGTLVQVKI